MGMRLEVGAGFGRWSWSEIGEENTGSYGSAISRGYSGEGNFNDDYDKTQHV